MTAPLQWGVFDRAALLGEGGGGIRPRRFGGGYLTALLYWGRGGGYTTAPLRWGVFDRAALSGEGG